MDAENYSSQTGINYPMKNVKRTTKTIEKWGPDGEYLGKEVIVTDEENVQVQDWSNQLPGGTWVGTTSQPVIGNEFYTYTVQN